VVSNKIKSNLTLKVTSTGLPMYNEYGNLEYDSTPTAVYFDDMFLSDGHRQLRI
jgi:hypothetical protein